MVHNTHQKCSTSSWIDGDYKSPYHPQSNGLAERAVEVSKVLLKRCQKYNSDITLALLNVRNTPREAGLMSINQRLMSRMTRSLLPSTTSSLKPRVVEGATESLGPQREENCSCQSTHNLPAIAIINESWRRRQSTDWTKKMSRRKNRRNGESKICHYQGW
ncbi:hypothetical protein JTE90_025256 [Oedothorax gibbosus]|uniref:Integrase catalytic domain-containing protein n=1 Tax=Oedothorax gibbosus TaxID=931172 RepID=A0AAV6U7J9_9ARAC|nr:hypothetical protein JTE90_025256 [Oedothorax gibbosus]